MRADLNFRKRREAQTLIFFLLAFGLICLLFGLAIDSGLLYLAKARLSRAVDGAALQAVGNASQSPASVATIMRNFAIANYSDLQTISTTPTVYQSTYTVPGTGATGQEYAYTFADGTAGKDSTGHYRRYVQIIFQLGAGGQITSALCNARCPVTTYFMGYADGIVGGFSGVASFKDLKVSSSAIATRNPRLIMVVVDRSASMLSPGGGAFGLPAAVVTFLNFFDTSSDYIGLVSFSSAARVEMPLTTNFLIAGTNALYDTYQVNTNTGGAIPGVDPEEYGNVANYTNGTGSPIPPRRMKFGGQTAADEGLRLAMEQLMSNSGFTNPNVVKYIVLFTDGAWNTTRTMLAAPGYTNVFSYPTPPGGQSSSTYSAAGLNSLAASAGLHPVNSFSGLDWGYLPMPNLSPWPDYSNSVSYAATPGGSGSSFDFANHLHDVWQSADTNNEPVQSPHQIIGAPVFVGNGTDNSSGEPTGYILNYYGTYYYTCSVNVWLPPGSVDYVYASGNSTPILTAVSDYTNPTMTTNITLSAGQSNVLVVPGYIVDGVISDALDLPYPDDPSNGGANYLRYRDDGYNQAFMWPDDQSDTSSASAINDYTVSDSIERNLLFRNYANLLTGYYIMRPDDPLGPSTSTNSFTGAVQPLHGSGPYYPNAGFYFPFDLVAVDQSTTFSLVNSTYDPDFTQQGLARHIAYSINMLSPAAAPQYAGELFYAGRGGTSSLSGTSAASTQITSAATWQSAVPGWTAAFSTLMKDDSTNSAVGGANWRPASFNGSTNSAGAVARMAQTTDSNLTSEVRLSDSSNKTGGYVSDGNGNIYRNAMCYSGRPTHYYDFSTSQWKPIPDNHSSSTFDNSVTLPLALGNWKAQEYAWHARQAGVTIFTVGYGSDVNSSECSLLAQVANAVKVVSPAGGTNPDGSASTTTNASTYIVGQPEGQQFYATTPSDISNDFYQVGTAISGALTQ